MIEEFKDEIKGLKNILTEIEKTRTIEINEKKKKNETQRMLNMLDDETNNILGKLNVDLATLGLKCEFFEKRIECNSIKMERNLRILTKKRINGIKRLKEEAKNKEDKLLDGETKIFKLLTDLEYEEHDAVHNIALLESKLIKLEISPERVDRIKNSVL